MSFKEFKVAKTIEDYKRIDAHNIRAIAANLLDLTKTIYYKMCLYKTGIINQRQLFKLVINDYFLFSEDYIDRLSRIEFGGRDAVCRFRTARECIAHGSFDTNDPKILEDCLMKAICIFEKLAHI